MFAAELHIPPWSIGELTVDQFMQAIDHFKNLISEAEKIKARR